MERSRGRGSRVGSRGKDKGRQVPMAASSVSASSDMDESSGTIATELVNGGTTMVTAGTITKTGVAAPSVTAAQSDVSAFVETMAPAVTGLDEEDDEEDEDRDDERTRDPNQPPPSKRCRRTPRPSVILTDLELEAMAEFLKDNEGLYNKARDMWRDSAARARLFEQQAATMDNRTGPKLQQWYEGLRSKIGRLQRKAKKSGTLKDSHVRLLELFKFLTPHIMNVQRRNPAKLSEKISQQQKQEEEEEDAATRDVEADPDVTADAVFDTTASLHTAGQDLATDPYPVRLLHRPSQIPLTVPLHSPNGRQMPAVRVVQGDCERVYCPVTSSSSGQVKKESHSSVMEQDADLMSQLLKNQQNSDYITALSAQLLCQLDARPRPKYHDREKFANWVNAALQDLPADLYHRASRMISNIIHDVQEEASHRFEQQQQGTLPVSPQQQPDISTPAEANTSGVLPGPMLIKFDE